jgi:lysozyme family protein
MAKVELLIPFLLKWEGGFVNDPLDKGGATNRGVTIATLKGYRKEKGLPEPTVDDLKALTDAEWVAILKEKYWDRWKADFIESQAVANILVDWVWASGVYGIKIPQRLLKVKEDGIVGKITLEAVNGADKGLFFNEVMAARIRYIDDICRKTPSNERFRRGWLNRLRDLSVNCELKFTNYDA